MRFTCGREALAQALAPAFLAVSSKNTISALEGFLISADAGEGTLEICGYDLEKGVKVTISGDAVNVEEGGSFIVTASKFLQIVKNLGSDLVKVTCDANYLLKVSGGRSEFTLHAAGAEAFPVLPELGWEKTFGIAQKTLKELITGVLFAVAQNNPRPTYNGALIEIAGGGVKAVGVDGFRLAMRRKETAVDMGGEDDGGAKFIVPGKSLSELSKLLNDGGEPAQIEVSRKHVVVSMGNIVFFSRLIEGEYLDYGKVIPSDFRSFAYVQRSVAINSVERASLLLDDRTKHIKLEFSPERDALALSSATSLGEVHEECPIKMTGEPITIGFNSRYLLDALSAAGEEELLVRMESPMKAAVITSEKSGEAVEPEFLYLVLPVNPNIL